MLTGAGRPGSSGRRDPRASAVLVIAAASAFMLCGYEILRSVSVSLFIEAYGTGGLPYVMAASPVFLIALVYVYGRLLSWLGPSRALAATSLLSAAILTLLSWRLSAGSRPAAAVLYMVREGYVVLLIEQYWSFINSTLSPDQARKLNGPIVGISSLGSILGGLLAHQLAVGVGSRALVVVGAGLLLPSAALAMLAYRHAGEPLPTRAEAGGRQGQLALRLLFGSRYLLGLAGLVWLTQIVSTVFDLRFNALVAAARPSTDARTAYFGGFYATLNGAAAAMQFVVAPLALRWFSLRSIHRALPIVHVVTSLVLLARSSLWTGGVAFLLFKILDYSLFRAAKEIFYLPLSFDARYRSKQIIDSFGYRFSKATTSGLVALATRIAGALPGFVFPVTAIAAASGWWALVGRLAGAHARRASRATEDPA